MFPPGEKTGSLARKLRGAKTVRSPVPSVLMVSMRLIRSAQWKAERSKLEAEKVERDLRNIARERLLPDDKILEKVSRYEAHLSRLMFKALHELEALQVRRSGGTAPLARLDVDGLAGD